MVCLSVLRLQVEFKVEVYDEKSNLIKSVHVSDERNMGGKGGWKKKFPLHLVSIVQDALNNPDIYGALTSESPKTTTVVSSSSDLIITRKGEEINVIVEEITSETIKYRKAGQIDGPLRNIPVSEVFMIKYQDGTKETFD